MNLNEAYLILELSEDASPEEAKKKYRELTKKYHPDINKDDGAEDRFKRINEAYQCVQNGKGNDREQVVQNRYPFDPFGFNKRQVPDIDIQPIQAQTQISFKDSVLGCKRDIVYCRKIKCAECNGMGHVQLNNGCDKCGGRGQISGRQGAMMFTQTCDKCGGRTSSRPCHKCKTKGYVDAEVSVQVTIPGGIVNGNTLRLGNMGHYAGNFMGMMGMPDQYTDVYLNIWVTSEPGLSLEGKDVVSSIQISLLEALQGCKKTINTIHGGKEIDINALSKHREEVIIPNLGVNGIGNQRILLNIDYPKDVSLLIDALTNKEN